ncbi:MAG TPA: ABC transporter permease [Bryobacteraceae bacterium]|nr:ABC transporter permease [Bryobacteraceae bacterium]
MALLEDVRFGIRAMATHPGFTATAAIALALGIGANATVFAIADAALYKNMPFMDDGIMYLSTKNVSRGQQRMGVSWPDFRDWQNQIKSFDGMAGFDFNIDNISDKSGLPTRYNVAAITANTFSLIGQKPVMGRDFTPEDEKRSANPVVILGYGVWENRYGKDASLLGKTIRVNDVPTTVIGVMRNGFRFPYDSDMWTAFQPGDNAEKRENRFYGAIGRLAAGASEKSAAVEMNGIAHNLAKAYPATNEGVEAVVHNFSEDFNGPNLVVLLASLLGAVAFVLLIACANVANLLLARAVDRAREISIRIALGAGRWRIIRQLLVESVMLSILGGVLGWFFSFWGLKAFDAAVRAQVPAWMNFSMDYRGFAFLAAISVGTGLLFGLAPALRLSRLDVNASLKDQSRGSSRGRRGHYLSTILVVTEIALAVVLLAGAGLMIRSFMNVYTMKTGVNPKNVLVMRLFLPEARYPKDQDQIAFHDRLKSSLDALPGVQVSSIAITMPTGGAWNLPYEIEGDPPADPKRRPMIGELVISPDYFRAMDVKVQRGRVFTEADGVGGVPVVIVNQRFAEKFFPKQDPIGKRLRTYDGDKPGAWLTVVGVVPNIVQNLPNQNATRELTALVYVPYREKPVRDMSIMARTTVPPNSLGTAFRQAVAAIDDDMPLYNMRSLQERLDQNNWPQKVFGSLFAIFALIAVVLASVGLYAVIAHSVNQRTQEIGLRMALGASAERILRLIFVQGLRQILIGLTIGVAAAIGLTRVLTTILVNVSPRDPATLMIVSLVLIAAAFLGCLLPARRAMKVDPVVALRHE